MAAVHWINEWRELKCSKYRFRPAVDILRIFWSGCSSFDLVGRESIYSRLISFMFQVYGKRMPATNTRSDTKSDMKAGMESYHLNRRVGQVDELWQNLPIFAGGIQLGGIP